MKILRIVIYRKKTGVRISRRVIRKEIAELMVDSSLIGEGVFRALMRTLDMSHIMNPKREKIVEAIVAKIDVVVEKSGVNSITVAQVEPLEGGVRLFSGDHGDVRSETVQHCMIQAINRGLSSSQRQDTFSFKPPQTAMSAAFERITPGRQRRNRGRRRPQKIVYSPPMG